MKATEIVCILDKSGSMYSIVDDTIGGFNTFLKDQQKQKGKINLTVITFDTEYNVWETKPIKKHPKLTTKNYVPGGATALLDAVGRGVSELQARLDKLTKAKRPDKVIFLIITDGQENSSKEFRTDQIKKMVEEKQEKNDWQFMFIGAGIDAFTEGMSIGIPMHLIGNVAATGRGLRSAYAAGSRAVSTYNTTGQIDDSWKDELDSEENNDSETDFSVDTPQ
jgi:Mg-chelatase subunit ChlD